MARHLLLTLMTLSLVPRVTLRGPQPWPEVFHAALKQNRSGALASVDLYYEWPKGRNANLIHQTGETLYDIEYNNRTSFYFRRSGTCKQLAFEVGILRPDFLSGAELVNIEIMKGVECRVWAKADFITYWEDIHTGLPVRWVFFDGARFDVESWTENATLAEAQWQAPPACFASTGSARAPAAGQLVPPTTRVVVS